MKFRYLRDFTAVASAIILVPCILFAARTPDEDPLSKSIRLDGQATTLKAVTASILTQSGVQVTIPGNLRGRRMEVASVSQSLRQVLDAICGVEGWTWTATGSGTAIVIKESAPTVDRDETVYSAYRRTIPPDMVNYFRMPRPGTYSRSGVGDGALNDRRASLEFSLSSTLAANEDKLSAAGLRMSEIKPLGQELVLLTMILSPRCLPGFMDLNGNTDWQLASPQATRLSIEQGTILFIDCDLGPGHGITSFGTNLAVGQ